MVCWMDEKSLSHATIPSLSRIQSWNLVSDSVSKLGEAVKNLYVTKEMTGILKNIQSFCCRVGLVGYEAQTLQLLWQSIMVENMAWLAKLINKELQNLSSLRHFLYVPRIHGETK